MIPEKMCNFFSPKKRSKEEPEGLHIAVLIAIFHRADMLPQIHERLLNVVSAIEVEDVAEILREASQSGYVVFRDRWLLTPTGIDYVTNYLNPSTQTWQLVVEARARLHRARFAKKDPESEELADFESHRLLRSYTEGQERLRLENYLTENGQD